MALLDLLLLALSFANISNFQEYTLKQPMSLCSLFDVIKDKMNEYNSPYLSDIEELEHQKLLIDHIIGDPELNICSSDFFSVNPTDDTVVVIFERPYVIIFSSECSSYIKYSCSLSNKNRNYVNIHNEMGMDVKILDSNNQLIMNRLIPNYEKELLLNWDTDSIDILCLYDQCDYDVVPESYVYRIVINNSLCKIDFHHFSKIPAVPNQQATESQLNYRATVRERLKVQNPRLYKKYFYHPKNDRLSELFTNVLKPFNKVFKRTNK